MDNDIKTWLYDILQSINEIDNYYSDKPRIFDDYVSDIKTKRAVERNLEIIGEAVNRILKNVGFVVPDFLMQMLQKYCIFELKELTCPKSTGYLISK